MLFNTTKLQKIMEQYPDFEILTEGELITNDCFYLFDQILTSSGQSWFKVNIEHPIEYNPRIHILTYARKKKVPTK